MPAYDYVCTNCKTELKDVEQYIRDKPLVTCGVCKKQSLERVISAPHVFVRGSPTTIGQLSERNSKKLGRYETQERTIKDKDEKKQALKEAKKEIHSTLNSMSESQKERYIQDGRL